MDVVVGYHLTPEGQAALDEARVVARERGARLHLVSLVPLPQNSEDARGYERARSEEQARLEGVADQYAQEGLDCRAHVPNGVKRAADAILSVAHIERADLIVIGMRRRSRVGKLVLGSTAQEVLLDSECHVLSVKAPAES